MNSQDQQFAMECERAQDVITNQLIEIMESHGDKWGIKNESLNVDKRAKEIKGAVRAGRNNTMRAMRRHVRT